MAFVGQMGAEVSFHVRSVYAACGADVIIFASGSHRRGKAAT